MTLSVVYPIGGLTQSAMVQAQRTFEKAAQSIATGLIADLNPADRYVASGLDTSIRSARQAIENAQSGYNFTATADSALAGISENLQRIRELSIQASNGIYSDSQVSAMQEEINQNIDQIKQTLGNATFNGKQSLTVVNPDNPDAAPVVDFMVGENSTSVISYDPNIVLGDMNFDVSTPDAAAQTIAQVDEMLGDIGSKRGEIGALQTSFEGAINQQSSNILSLSSSLSGIQDTDYITAITELKKSQFTMEVMAKVMKAAMNADRYVLDLLQ